MWGRMNKPADHWDQLHEHPRFRPAYPNDHVVRFLVSSRVLLAKSPRPRLLDIGTGSGRHLRLAADLDFEPFGMDISSVGLQHVRRDFPGFPLARASMLRLPFAGGSFDIALSFGVFCYGTGAETRQAIAEAHRVLAIEGRLFAVLRTTQDYRFGRGESLGDNSFRLTIADTNEFDTVQHFLTEEQVQPYFRDFSSVSYEKTETTFAHRTRLDSDWLVTATR